MVHEPEREKGRYHGKTLAPLPQQPKQSREKSEARQSGKRPSYEAPPSPLSGLSGELGRIFRKISSLSLETEDLLLIAILYLMYRVSGDQDFLIMIGAFLFL